MTSDQLLRIKCLRENLDDIRGNEELVEAMKAETESLIRDGVSEAKQKMDVLAEFDSTGGNEEEYNDVF